MRPRVFLAVASCFVFSSAIAGRPARADERADEPGPEVLPPVVATTPELAPAPIPLDPSSGKPEKPPRSWHLAGKLAAGPEYRRLFGSYFTGGDVRGAIGGEGKNLAFYLTLGGIFASSEFDLAVHSYNVGASIEGIYDRFRLGAGAQFAFLGYTRVTQPGNDEWTLGFGLHGFVSFDILQFDEHAVFLAGDLTGDYYGSPKSGSATFAWGPSGLLGVRF